jgi:hypothetical protein
LVGIVQKRESTRYLGVGRFLLPDITVLSLLRLFYALLKWRA